MLENTSKVFHIEHRCRKLSPSCRKWVSPPLPSPQTSIPNLWSVLLYRMSLVTSCCCVPPSAVGMCICVPYGRRCSEQGVSCKLWHHYQREGWDGCFMLLLSSAPFKEKLVISFTVLFLWPLALLQTPLHPQTAGDPPWWRKKEFYYSLNKESFLYSFSWWSF